MDTKDIEKMKEFARYVIQRYCWDYDIRDGGNIQDKAEGLGLITSHRMTAEEKSDYSDYPHLDVGDTVFTFTDVLK